MKEVTYIATSHGEYAKGTIETLKMLTGEEVSYISFLNGMSKEELKKIYLKFLNENKSKKYVFVTDIFAGTPFNTLVEIKGEYMNLDIIIITGLSLILLIELLDNGVSKNLFESLIENTKIIEKIEMSSILGEEED
ncbi:hypothetical protein OQE61_04015 [Cetobacterium somerae]|uniref:PTS sugar transporter subunit IIA n=1 Tax=Cetobacterium somerae TaxID=188913 RepID=UPI0022564C6B|nr:hypothetical protein [Cetobacterium somerae]MCX3066653.1 hypothetical protein [Cetobacterium somerae]